VRRVGQGSVAGPSFSFASGMISARECFLGSGLVLARHVAAVSHCRQGSKSLDALDLTVWSQRRKGQTRCSELFERFSQARSS
jgi:hypothetical protein